MNDPDPPPAAIPEPPPIHPGDIIQVTAQGSPWRGAIGLVRERHSWGVGVDFLAVTETTGRIGVTYQRFKVPEVAVIGEAAIMPPELLAARRDALETERLVREEKN